VARTNSFVHATLRAEDVTQGFSLDNASVEVLSNLFEEGGISKDEEDII